MNGAPSWTRSPGLHDGGYVQRIYADQEEDLGGLGRVLESRYFPAVDGRNHAPPGIYKTLWILG